MTTPLPVGPLTPYVTAAVVMQAPIGVSFSSIPPGGPRAGVTTQQNLAEVANICMRATAMVDACCAQPLRATIDTLPLQGPGAPRVYVPRDDKPCTLIMTRWPVLSVVSVQVSPNTFPRAWTPVPAGNYEPKYPVVGLYGSVAPPAAGEGGQAITLAPGYIRWDRGPAGYLVETQFINGWPHAGLTAAATPVVSPATQTISVDDCTGWAVTAPYGGNIGAAGTVYDAGAQEVIHVTAASAAQGPGTLTLAAPLQYPHAAGVVVSTLPQSVVWAAILFCGAQALTRGATSTTVREVPGKSATGGAPRAQSLREQAEALLKPFARII